MVLIADLIAFLEEFAPPRLAEDWDNVGLLVGDRSREVSRVMTCLTLTADVADEAIEERAGFIVTHHPVLFRAVKRLTADDAQGKMVLRLIEAGLAVYSPHTGYDSAADGINRQLARMLGLTDVTPLCPVPSDPTCKIICFVPRGDLLQVQEAMWSAGAGVIGDYSKCSFTVDGVGTFFGSDAANPAVGKAGRLEQVAEARLEILCPERLVPETLARLRSAHPYEEPAFDVYRLRSEPGSLGAGCVGRFSLSRQGAAGEGRAGSLSDLMELAKDRLKLTTLPYVGNPDRPVSKVGICCGSGGELLPAVIEQKCDAFLTGEARFHTCLEARAAGIAILLAGHYATERPAMEYLATVLTGKFSELVAWASRTERDPIQCC